MKKNIPLAGAGGGGKQSSRTPYEAADNVASKTVASILDLLGEGVIGGLKNGEKSIFLDDVPVQNPDGSMNFKGVKTWERKGHQNQSPIDGFDDIETPRNVAAELRKDSPKTLSIDNDDTNRLRVIMEFPRLSSTDKSSGDINGASVQFEFALAVGADNFKPIAPVGFSSSVVTVSKKSSGKFQYEYLIDLPTGTKNRRVRVSRVTADSSNDYLQNKTIVASYGEIVFAKMSYPNSALVGITIDSREFGGNLPRRSYLVGGILIRVPSNYDPVSNEYKGDWDGSFEYRSSSNPAWILYDLLIEKRYGLGSYISESMIDVGKIYQIGRYCDQYVPDGFGGMEKRFTINTVIATRQEAFKVINDIASVFRGMVFWAGGMINLRQDSPSSPVMQFSAANIIDKITRKGSARKDRPTVALITYNDKDDLYKQNVEYVEDEDAKKEHGIRKIESLAFGCTSRGQANRVGLWILYTSKMETDVVIFKAGIDSSLLMPGDLVKVQDKYRSGKRNSGRVVSCTKNSITLDSSVNLANQGAFITFLTPEGKMVDRDLLQAAGNHTTVTFKSAIKDDEMPVSLGLWTITEPDLEPSLMRVISVKDEGKGVYEIMGVDHNPSKFAAIDQGAVLTPSKTTVLDPTYKKPENIQIEEATYISSPGNLSVKLLVSWDGFSPFYAIRYRRSDIIDNWRQLQLTDSQYEILSVPDKSSYDIEVFALSVTGKRTESISRTYKTVGTMTPPDAPKNLVAVGDYRQNIITWINPSSIDLEAVNVYGSKTNKIETATLLAKVPSTVFNHSGLEDDATWFYWVRAVNKRGMLSPANSNLGTKATTKEVMSFLKNKITETELSKDLLADINDNASDAAAEKVTAAVEVKVGEIKKAVDESKAASDKAVLDVTKNALSIDKEIAERKAAIKTLSDAAVSESQKRAEAIKKESDARVADIKKEATSRSNALKEESRLREESLKAESNARNTAILNEKTERGAAITASEKKSQTATDALATKVNRLSTATDANSAAIKKEEQARITADSSEAVERQSLASQMRGDYTGKDLTKVTAGLVFEEREARTSGDKAEASARQSLETRLGESVTAVNKSIESISTSQKAQSGEITAINTSLKNKAESSAVNSLNSKIEEQGKRLTSQGSAVTKLQNDLGLTNTSVGKKADSSALTALDSKVTQQGKDISSQSGSITALQNSLKTTNANVEKKADSSALSILDNKVIQQGKDISSTSNKTTALENSLKTTNANITKKADSSALTGLDSKVVQQGKDISSVSGSVTDLKSVLNPRSAFVVTAACHRSASNMNSTLTNEKGKVLVGGGRSFALVTFKRENDGSTSVDFSKVYDIYAKPEDGKALVEDVKKLPYGTSACIFTNDDPSQNRETITEAIEMLGGTKEAIAKIPHRGAYILVGFVGLNKGDAIELSATKGGNKNSFVKTSIEFIDGTLVGLGSSAGAIDISNANASAITKLDNEVKSIGGKVTSQSTQMSKLQNDLGTTNLNVSKKAESTALSSLDSKVTQQGKDISSVSGKTTALENSLKTTNANIGKKADSSALTALDSKVTQQGKDVSSANSSITRLSNTLKDMSVGGVNLFSESDSELGTVQESINVGSAYSAVKYPGDNRVRNKTLIDSGKGIVISINADYEYFVTCFDKSSKYLGSGRSFSWRKDLLVIPPFLGFVGVVVRRSDGAKMSLLDVVKSRIKVEIGNVRTDWSPSPFDIASVNDVSNIKLANSKVISGLDSKVTQQGKDISSVSGKTTALENSLKVTNNNVGKKADAAALNSLNSTVDKQGKDITSHGKSITALDNSTSSIKSGLDDTEILARITTNGKQIIPVPNFNEGKNDVYLYNNANNGNISIDVIGRRSTNPTTSSHEIAMTVKGIAAPNYGGFRREVHSKPNAVFVTKYIIKLPLGWALQANTNPLGDGYIDKFVGNREGTGKYETYYRVTKCGEVGKFQTFGYVSVYISDSSKAKAPTSASPMTWYLAQIEVYETTDYASATPEVTDFMSSAKTSLDSLTNATKSQSSQLTNLQNSLNTTNTNVGKKAESSALSALDSKVTQQGKDISSANSSITSLKSSILPRTVFLLKSAGAGSGIIGKITNDKGVVIATAERSYCLIVFKLNNDGSTVVESTKNYDVFANKDMGVALSKDVAALGNGKYAALITHDEPTRNRESILPAVERLGGTKETLYSFPHRGAYILAGRVGANKGDSIELASRTGNDKSAMVQTSIEFVNGVLMNHGNGGGIAILASTNANAISKLNTDTKATDGRVSSQSTQITKLQNDLNATNSNVSKKAESSALSALDSKVTQQGKNIDSVSSKTTSLENGLKTTNTNVGKKADTSALNTLSSKVTDVEGKVKSAASSVTALSSKIDQVKNDLTDLIEVDLDLSKLDENTYYPVTLNLNITTRYYFKVFRTLGQFSNNKPSYATHGSKTFATILEWSVSGEGWGTQNINRIIHNFGFRFVNQSPVLGPEQLANSSTEYVYLRGGSFYKLTKPKNCAHYIRTTKYTTDKQSVGPIPYTANKVPVSVGKATSDALSDLSTKISAVDGKLTSTANDVTRLKTTIGTKADSSALNSLSSTVTQQGKDITAQSTSLSQLTTKVNGQGSTISTLNKTVTDSNKSQAETNKTIESKFNGYTARINQVEKTVASGGGLNSTWMVKMEVRADGKKYASGIGLGVDGKTLQSQFLVQADRFALMNTANGKVTTPFVIDGGVTYINAASIKDGSIGSAKVGDLQSNNYAAGKTGWKFGKNGILEMNGQTSGQGRLSISNNRIDVYDEKGVLRVRLGLL
ncbi:phage tail tip fiber protein [Moellerella wisconsensis]|uniref:phage tail tip fiber protein n=2 Tax=Gammaproteobacteria TaxID=1236 RepID=UPI00069A1222|nr:phage tail protein [Moellerella wisconsensis]